MALVSFNKLQLFIQEQCSKHFKIGRKDLSRVAKFMSHNGIKNSYDIEFQAHR